jgi:hypothetical protein
MVVPEVNVLLKKSELMSLSHTKIKSNINATIAHFADFKRKTWLFENYYFINLVFSDTL